MCNRIVYALVAICILLPVNGIAQTFSPFQFLRVNQTARSAALGGSTVAMIEDPGAMFLNPAAISTVNERKITATFNKHVLDLNSGLLSFVNPINNATWGLAVSYSSGGTFNGADVFGVPTGKDYIVSQVSVGGMYSAALDSGFYYGVGANFVSATFTEGSTSALYLNGGIIYKIPRSRWNVGLSFLNVGRQLSKVGDVSEPLPMDVRVGVNHRLRGLPLLVNFSLTRLAEDHETVWERVKNFTIGGELYLGKVIEVRVGYDNAIRNAVSFTSQARMSGISAGVGIHVKNTNIDYAATSLISGVWMHRFGLSLGM